ncbi:MAG TPA: hypothetical protein VF778_01050 [Xanthobacteraceae bacterium]
MTDKRLFTTAIVLGLGLGLANCGGYVADHWPHWAGGLPADAPPRPGSPGYADFIAHGQADQDAANSTAAQQPTVGAVQAPVQKPSAPPAMAAPATPAAAPAAQAQGAPLAGVRPEDPSVLKGGGLY